MAEELLPNREEVGKWLLDTLRHVSHIEYFFEVLGLGESDPERPHDLVGPGNKYEWDVIRGFSLQYREPKVDFEQHIKPALTLHRKQHHHRMWNEPDPEDPNKPSPDATVADMLVGAVDANCSLLESRAYQGGEHDYDGVREVALTNPPHKTPWMLSLIPFMQNQQQPRLDLITGLRNLTNVGLDHHVYFEIQRRTREVLEMLETKGYEL